MTATYGEVGLSYGASNWTYDGSEIVSSVDALDISYVRCTYAPSIAVSHVAYTPSRAVHVVQTSIPRIVIHTGLAKTATYTPSIAKQGDYKTTVQRTGRQ